MRTTASIVIPTFNRAAYLKRCIEAALAQTVPCEVIVCDHGSTDETPLVARSFGDRIRYIRREHDSGIHFCWLDGIISATQEFVHLNFDDDYIQPVFMEKCLSLMAPDVGFCCTQAEVIFCGSEKKSLLNYDLGQTGNHPISRFVRFHLNSLVSPGAALIRKLDMVDALFIGQVPLTKHSYRGVGPDWLMTTLTSLKYPRYAFIAEPLAIFQAHENSITINALADRAKIKSFKKAYKEARRYFYIIKIASFLRLYFFVGLWLRLSLFRVKIYAIMTRFYAFVAN